MVIGARKNIMQGGWKQFGLNKTLLRFLELDAIQDFSENCTFIIRNLSEFP